ncbi:hypothetical protein BGX27_004248 [Mortierella sp. AM989]|nr:hypothetical protein BGX27_004248 [Mortierella sp. AM989]
MVLHTALFWLYRESGEYSLDSASWATGMTTNGTTGVLEPNHPILSNITGILSIICWFIVLVPQFFENYKRKSGESVSLPFLFIWLTGDLLNLLGATMDNLLLTMRFLAWYYVLSDFLLIGQVYYYRKRNAESDTDKQKSDDEVESSNSNNAHVTDDEETALLNNNDTQRNKSNNYYSTSTLQGQSNDQQNWSSQDHPIRNNESSQSQYEPSGYCNDGLRMSTASERTKEVFKRRRIRQILMILLPALATAFLVWSLIGWNKSLPGKTQPGNNFGGADEDSDSLQAWDKDNNNSDDKVTSLGLILGWGSAILYLGSRIPQIYKNWSLQSCEGLSIMMFIFSVLGNVFYVASIFFYSMDYDYLVQNMPWCVGSGGTLVFDFMVC